MQNGVFYLNYGWTEGLELINIGRHFNELQIYSISCRQTR